MVEQIFEYACLIRGAILRHRNKPALSELAYANPSESSAWLAAQYLARMGCNQVTIAKGTRALEDGQSLIQFWVEADGVAVDIQAERLPASHTSVIIADNSIFHEVFGAFGKIRRQPVTAKALEGRQDLVRAFNHLLGQNPALKNPHLLEANAV